MDWIDRFFGSYTRIYFWFIGLVAIAALIISAYSLHRIINDEDRLPPRIEGLDQAFLVASKGSGTQWSSNIVVPAQSKGLVQVNQGLNFANPIGSNRSGLDILPSDTFTNFGSSDYIAYESVFDKGTTVQIGTGLFGTLVLKSTANYTASIQMSGQVYIVLGTDGSPFYPVVGNLELQSSSTFYGNIQFVHNLDAGLGNINHFYCSITDGTLYFWYTDSSNVSHPLPVFGSSADPGVISFSIYYPLKIIPS